MCPKHYNACPSTVCPDRDAAQLAAAMPVTETYLPCNSCGRLLQVAPAVQFRRCTKDNVVLCGTGIAPDQQQKGLMK